MNKWTFSHRSIIADETETQTEIIVEDPTSEDVGIFVSLLQLVLDGEVEEIE